MSSTKLIIPKEKVKLNSSTQNLKLSFKSKNQVDLKSLLKEKDDSMSTTSKDEFFNFKAIENNLTSNQFDLVKPLENNEENNFKTTLNEIFNKWGISSFSLKGKKLLKDKTYIHQANQLKKVILSKKEPNKRYLRNTADFVFKNTDSGNTLNLNNFNLSNNINDNKKGNLISIQSYINSENFKLTTTSTGINHTTDRFSETQSNQQSLTSRINYVNKIYKNQDEIIETLTHRTLTNVKSQNKFEELNNFKRQNEKSLKNKKKSLYDSIRIIKKRIKEQKDKIDNLFQENDKIVNSDIINNSGNEDSEIYDQVKDVDFKVLKKKMDVRSKIHTMYNTLIKVSDLENYKSEYYKVPEIKNTLTSSQSNYGFSKRKLERLSMSLKNLKKSDNNEVEKKSKNALKDDTEIEFKSFKIVKENNVDKVIRENMNILNKYIDKNYTNTDAEQVFCEYFKYKNEYYSKVGFADEKEAKIIHQLIDHEKTEKVQLPYMKRLVKGKIDDKHLKEAISEIKNDSKTKPYSHQFCFSNYHKKDISQWEKVNLYKSNSQKIKTKRIMMAKSYNPKRKRFISEIEFNKNVDIVDIVNSKNSFKKKLIQTADMLTLN